MSAQSDRQEARDVRAEERDVRKGRLNRTTAAAVVAVLTVLVWGILEADERNRVGDLEKVIDPCGGSQTRLTSEACRARTCIRLDSVDGNPERISAHLHKFFPDCRGLGRRVEDGEIDPGILSDEGSGGGGTGDGQNPSGQAPPGSAPGGTEEEGDDSLLPDVTLPEITVPSLP